MAIGEANLIILEANQLPDAIIAASLAISQNGTAVMQKPKILGPKVRVIANKAVTIKAMVLAMV